MINKQSLMKRAWRIARKGASRFGGNVRAYFRLALIAAWNEYRAKRSTTYGEAKAAQNAASGKPSVAESHGLASLVVRATESAYTTLKTSLKALCSKATDSAIARCFRKFQSLTTTRKNFRACP